MIQHASRPYRFSQPHQVGSFQSCCSSTRATSTVRQQAAHVNAASYTIRRARPEDIPELAAMCAEAFITEAPEAPGFVTDVQRKGQKALVQYAEKTLKAQIEKTFTVKRKAAQERRASRMEAQAQAMRAELALLTGESFVNLWSGMPSAIQQKADKRRRESQQVMWFVARANSSAIQDAAHNQQEAQSYAASSSNGFMEPVATDHSSVDHISGLHTEADGSTHNDSLPSDDAIDNDGNSVESFTSIQLRPGALLDKSSNEGQSTTHREQSGNGASTTVSGDAERTKAGTLVGCALVTLSAAEAILPPPWPTRALQRCYVGNMAVNKAWRRQGVATALLRECERLAMRWRHDSLWLHTEVSNTSAQRLYARAGYDKRRVDPWFYGRMQQVLLAKDVPKRAARQTMQHEGKTAQVDNREKPQLLMASHQEKRDNPGAYIWRVGKEDQ